jgi:histidyl-tRNA synthetase
MATIRPVRGTHDLFGETIRRHRQVIDTGRATAALYGYEEIATPIFEFTEVFKRSLGDTSDVVTKEMYTFEDRGGESLTLRPENTASVARAIISNGLLQSPPLKLFYAGPMFRYERPQKGRLRQFHQIGVELIGAPQPLGDVEVIAIGAHILDRLGIADLVTLELNTLGDPDSRQAYRQQLVSYLDAFRDRLSEDSRLRLERNPMRILDSKNEDDRRIVADAPKLEESLNQASRDFFAEVRARLDELGITYRLNPHLVRGLDYYTHTAFEFTTTALGAQGAVIAGGRYDGLVEEIGGPSTPGVGWAAGVERLALLATEEPRPARPVAIVPIGPAAEAEARRLAAELRHGGIAVELAFSGKPGQRMKRADRANARFALSLGDAELESGMLKLRDLDSGTETTVERQRIAAHLGAVGK